MTLSGEDHRITVTKSHPVYVDQPLTQSLTPNTVIPSTAATEGSYSHDLCNKSGLCFYILGVIWTFYGGNGDPPQLLPCQLSLQPPKLHFKIIWCCTVGAGRRRLSVRKIESLCESVAIKPRALIIHTSKTCIVVISDTESRVWLFTFHLSSASCWRIFSARVGLI